MFYVWKSLVWSELRPLMHRARILKPGIPAKKFALVLFLVFNSLVWHTLAYAKLSAYVHNDLLILGGYYAGIAFSAILGASLFRRSRETCLILWALLGAAMTALLAMWGYKIKKQAEAKFGVKLRHGALYPLLSELERDSFIIGQNQQQGGRKRKVYTLTSKGQQYLEAYGIVLKEQLQRQDLK